jgi:hypothetical protein
MQREILFWHSTKLFYELRSSDHEKPAIQHGDFEDATTMFYVSFLEHTLRITDEAKAPLVRDDWKRRSADSRDV